MRPIAATLLTTLALATSSLAQDAAPASAPVVPKMTREEAVAYLGDRLALTGSNLVGPIMNADAETVEALLSAGVDVNDTSDMPKSALRLATSACAMGGATIEERLVVIEVLLAHGAKVDEPEGAILTPLIVATQNCPPVVAKRLLDAGAKIDFKTAQGYSALSMALLLGKYDTAEMLIDAGARISAEAGAKLLENKKDDAKLAALVKRATGK